MCTEPLTPTTAYREPGRAILVLFATIGALYVLTILLAPGIALLIALAVVGVKVVGAVRRRGRSATEVNNP